MKRDYQDSQVNSRERVANDTTVDTSTVPEVDVTSGPHSFARVNALDPVGSTLISTAVPA
jgi:hypothetical protein